MKEITRPFEVKSVGDDG
jgi:HK97 family phage prohead protease